MPLFNPPASAGSGTVTSVGLTASGLLHNVSGSPVTTAGTLALTLKTQVAGAILCGPISGADAAPTMRALDPLDVPTLDAAKIGSGTFADARLASGITGSKISGALSGATLATSALTGTIAASQLAVSSPTSGQLGGLATGNLSASAGLVAGQIASVNPSALTGSGTVPLAGLSGLTTSQLAAGAAILGSQLDAAAAIASGQITSLAAAKLTGTNTLPDGVLSTNVPLLASANTFTAAQTVSATVASVLATLNNASTTGGGLAIGSTTIASAGAGKIAPALSLTQAAPATANYGLLSIGNGPWDGSTSGKFAGNANGSYLAINAASGYTGALLDAQINGVSLFSYTQAAGLTVKRADNSASVLTAGSSGIFALLGIRNNSTNLTLGSTSDSSTKVINAAIALAKAAKTGTYTMTAADTVILADATSAAFTVTLPAANAIAGQLVHVKKTDSGGNAVTVSRAGSDTVEGATTLSLASQYASCTLISDGSALWYKVASN